MPKHISARRHLTIVAWFLVLAGAAAAQQQTIYWSKDHIYNGPGGQQIATVTPLPADQVAPGAPTNLTVSDETSTSVQLNWTASVDTGGSGLAGFKIYRQRGSQANLPITSVGPGTTTFTDQHLEAANYTFTIVAFDKAQNHSGPSNSITLTRGPDTTNPGQPSQMVATATTATQVNLTWASSTDNVGVDHYRIERRFNGEAYAQIGTSTTTSYTDATAAAGVAYLYRIRAVDGAGNNSAYSNADLATTIIFADDPLAVGITSVKAQHFNQLRQAVNGVRATAGLAAAAWTDATLEGVLVKAVHLQELRSNLSAARAALGFTSPGYTDPTLSVGVTTMKKAHIEELRQNVK